MAGIHSPEQLRKMRQIFLQFDQCGDCNISHSQLGECLRVLGSNPSEASIRQYIRELIASCYERVSFDEFLPIYDCIMSRSTAHQFGADTAFNNEQFKSGLRFFDEHKTGYISADRLRRVLTTSGERLTEVEVNDLLENHVNDQDLVNYEEFVNAITKS
ncbi:myosin-2 essential light chain [Drosophila grimshawi]|uniref:GH13789 n=1 Tax=Drosophila grimshawi TaxID=7222 RepID=B4JQZ6_DROGR|nr:myosin-2 essential light chain [Drosophila grimshawi]EDV99326.1 GH13789 [Drosophila grimshawi]